MFCMLVNIFNDIMFIIVMVMPCDIISYVTCIEFLFVIVIISNAQ